jgi:hypothetical protein
LEMKTLTLAALLVAPALTPALYDGNALGLVKRAIESDARTSYTCIREWTPWGNKETVRVRRDQSDSGANRVLVLAPICQQGFTVVDNGKQRASYNPDRRELTIQDSPLQMLATNDAARRFEVLRKNYRISLEGMDRVADRPAARIRLDPVAEGALFGRRYWIDKEKSVLLRVEWRSPTGARQVVSDTVSITFPKELPAETFATRFSVGAPREIRVQSPSRQKNLGALAQAVGFRIINPIEMPFGFLYIGADAIKGRNRTMAALRYTDGAANVTVYQASGQFGPAPWRYERRLPNVQVDGIWLTVDGDVPDEGKEVILEALRESGIARESDLRARVVSMLKADAATVGSLRDMGLSFGDVVSSLAAAKGNRAGAIKEALGCLAGKSSDDPAAKQAAKRFWGMRESEK